MSTAELAELLKGAFPSRVRRRGEEYFQDEAVQLEPGDDSTIKATVWGKQGYRVSLRLVCPPGHPPDLKGVCTCPFFLDSGPCKHLWALILEASFQVEDGDLENPLNLPTLDALLGSTAEDRRVAATVREPEAPTQKGNRRETPPAHWSQQLKALEHELARSSSSPWSEVSRGEERILYHLDVEESRIQRAVVLTLLVQKKLKHGGWSKGKSLPPGDRNPESFSDPQDRQIFAALRGAHTTLSELRRSRISATSYGLEPGQLPLLLPVLCETRRFSVPNTGGGESVPFLFEDGAPWSLGIRVVRSPAEESQRSETATLEPDLEVKGFLARGSERMDLTAPLLLLPQDFLFTASRVMRFDDRGAGAWLGFFLTGRRLLVPRDEEETLVRRLLELPGRPLLDLPDIEVDRTVRFRPKAVFSTPDPEELPEGETSPPRGAIPCHISFDYDGTEALLSDPTATVFRPDAKERAERDREKETASLQFFLDRGGRAHSSEDREASSPNAEVDARALPDLVAALLEEDWIVESDGNLYHRAEGFAVAVRSGIDWLDVSGGMQFPGEVVSLPALLEAARLGSRSVRLSDGSYGILPPEWREEWGLLEALGKVRDGRIRFLPQQGWILDALLGARDDVDFDDAFSERIERLRAFEQIGARSEPAGFLGKLRGYQRESLGWFEFLREFSFGGCLADDMGLGKTIQVLALLAERKAGNSDSIPRPSLVVAPRSLTFNWREEATRFAPQLRVLSYTGSQRKALFSEIASSDLVLTTYGTLRRDIFELQKVDFDYVILDEAQAIKNSSSQAAKASRLLHSQYRLALSGTPIENHIGELWSLFEFLNPGMLGKSKALRELTQPGGDTDSEEKRRSLLCRALRPFFLRRTKEQVLHDLPEKSEQILYCEMGATQGREYAELKEHYRNVLLSPTKGAALSGSRIEILEALLRLRQAACHPGLLDPERVGEDSKKLETLLDLLREITATGHRALVFSQFTKFLGILRRHLEEEGIVYEYLDGRTKDRQSKVDRFQNDESCSAFLISLKAGGVGLNLTAADYVFLLDPWWNPAVERQAIDRAHRMGQRRKVMAYRLICRETVEEKVLELQGAKRELAQALLSSDESPLRDLTRQDLETLLS